MSPLAATKAVANAGRAVHGEGQLGVEGPGGDHGVVLVHLRGEIARARQVGQVGALDGGVPAPPVERRIVAEAVDAGAEHEGGQQPEHAEERPGDGDAAGAAAACRRRGRAQ